MQNAIKLDPTSLTKTIVLLVMETLEPRFFRWTLGLDAFKFCFKSFFACCLNAVCVVINTSCMQKYFVPLISFYFQRLSWHKTKQTQYTVSLPTRKGIEAHSDLIENVLSQPYPAQFIKLVLYKVALRIFAWQW